jgi:hypothetical protein
MKTSDDKLQNVQIFTWKYRFGKLNFRGQFYTLKMAKIPSFFVRLSFVHGSFILYSKSAAHLLMFFGGWRMKSFFLSAV